MLKKVIGVALALIMTMSVVGIVPTIAAKSASDTTYDVKGGKIYFDSATGTVTGCDGEIVNLTIPEKINGVAVTSIGEYAFAHCDALVNVTMPNIEHIETNGFYGCDALERVSMANVKKIDAMAFHCCESLISIEVTQDNSFYSTEDGVLFNKSKTELITYPTNKAKNEPDYITPESVTKIGDSAFDNCVELHSITMPNVKSVGDSAFMWCNALESASMPNVTNISGSAFAECYSLMNVVMPKVTDIDGYAFYYSNLTGDLYLPNVESIGGCAFCGCNQITSVEMSNVTSIESHAFSSARIKSVEIPKIANIDGGAFVGCTSLVSIDAGTCNEAYATEDGVLFNRNKTELVIYPAGKADTFYKVPRSVKQILDEAFSGNEALQSVSMPSVTNIGIQAFSNCRRLTEVYIPKFLTYIGYGAFGYCDSLSDGGIYYEGTAEDRADINIDGYNDSCLNATWHYNHVFDRSESLQAIGDYAEKIEAAAAETESGITVKVKAKSASVDKKKIQCFAASADGSAAKKLKGVISGSEVVFETDDKDARIFIWDENMRPMTEAY